MSEKETVKEIIYKVIVSETITKEISDIKKMCKYYHSDIQRLNIEVDTIKEDRLEALETAVNQLIGEKAKNKKFFKQLEG